MTQTVGTVESTSSFYTFDFVHKLEKSKLQRASSPSKQMCEKESYSNFQCIYREWCRRNPSQVKLAFFSFKKFHFALFIQDPLWMCTNISRNEGWKTSSKRKYVTLLLASFGRFRYMLLLPCFYHTERWLSYREELYWGFFVGAPVNFMQPEGWSSGQG